MREISLILREIARDSHINARDSREICEKKINKVLYIFINFLDYFNSLHGQNIQNNLFLTNGRLET